jgi:O-antigen ligase
MILKRRISFSREKSPMNINSFRERETNYIIVFGLLAIVLGYAAGIYTGLTPNLLEYIIILLGIPALVVFLGYPEIGLLFFHFTNILRLSDNLNLFYGTPHFIYPLTVLMILLILARWVINKDEPKGWVIPFVLVLFYGLVAISGLFFAKDIEATQQEIVGLGRGVAITMITVLMVQKKEVFRRLIWVLLIAGIILGTIAVFQYFTDTFNNNYWGFAQSKVQSIVGQTEASRIGGPFGDPNQFAQILVFLAPIAFNQILNEKKPWLRILAVWATTVCSLVVIFSYSRGGLLALAVAMLVILFYHRPRLVNILLVLTILIGVASYIPNQYMARMKTMVDLISGRMDPREEISIRTRASAYLVGFRMFIDHPFLGVGMHNFSKQYQDYARQIGLDPYAKEWAPHSLYLEVLSEMGLLGFISFSLILWTMFKRTWQAWKLFLSIGLKEYAAIVAGVGAGLIGYFTAGLFLQNSYSRYFWALVGIAFALQQVAQNALAEIKGENHKDRNYFA